jgi:hypothetical protein
MRQLCAISLQFLIPVICDGIALGEFRPPNYCDFIEFNATIFPNRRVAHQKIPERLTKISENGSENPTMSIMSIHVTDTDLFERLNPVSLGEQNERRDKDIDVRPRK